MPSIIHWLAYGIDDKGILTQMGRGHAVSTGQLYRNCGMQPTALFYNLQPQSLQTAAGYLYGYVGLNEDNPPITLHGPMQALGSPKLLEEMTEPAQYAELVQSNYSYLQALLVVHGHEKVSRWGRMAITALREMFTHMNTREGIGVAFSDSRMIQAALWMLNGKPSNTACTEVMADYESLSGIEFSLAENSDHIICGRRVGFFYPNSLKP
jgi:hypothetical protein